MSILASFVAQEDYPKLLEILRGIHYDTLRKKVSILGLRGYNGCGATTLMDIMKTIASTSSRVDVRHWGRSSRNGPYQSVLPFEAGIIIIVGQETKNASAATIMSFNDEISTDNGCSVYEHRLHQAPEERIWNPGVCVLNMAPKHLVPCRVFRERMPMYLDLPYDFTRDRDAIIPNDSVVKIAMEEFKQHIIDYELELEIRKSLYQLLLAWKKGALMNFPRDVIHHLFKILRIVVHEDL